MKRFISRPHEPPVVVFAWLASVKERKGFIALMCGTRDHPDAFPQSIVRSSNVRCSIIYAFASLCIVYCMHYFSSIPDAVTLA